MLIVSLRSWHSANELPNLRRQFRIALLEQTIHDPVPTLHYGTPRCAQPLAAGVGLMSPQARILHDPVHTRLVPSRISAPGRAILAVPRRTPRLAAYRALCGVCRYTLCA